MKAWPGAAILNVYVVSLFNVPVGLEKPAIIQAELAIAETLKVVNVGVQHSSFVQTLEAHRVEGRGTRTAQSMQTEEVQRGLITIGVGTGVGTGVGMETVVQHSVVVQVAAAQGVFVRKFIGVKPAPEHTAGAV